MQYKPVALINDVKAGSPFELIKVASVVSLAGFSLMKALACRIKRE
jgi:hypothetical protein